MEIWLSRKFKSTFDVLFTKGKTCAYVTTKWKIQPRDYVIFLHYNPTNSSIREMVKATKRGKNETYIYYIFTFAEGYKEFWFENVLYHQISSPWRIQNLVHFSFHGLGFYECSKLFSLPSNPNIGRSVILNKKLDGESRKQWCHNNGKQAKPEHPRLGYLENCPVTAINLKVETFNIKNRFWI